MGYAGAYHCQDLIQTHICKRPHLEDVATDSDSSERTHRQLGALRVIRTRIVQGRQLRLQSVPEQFLRFRGRVAPDYGGWDGQAFARAAPDGAPEMASNVAAMS